MELLKGKNKQMLESSNEPMIICKPGFDAVCIDLNKKYEELLGYSREELINKSTAPLALPDEKQANLTKHASLDGKVTTWDNMHLIKKDGTKIKITAASFPLYDEQGNVFAYSHIVKEVAKAPDNSLELDSSNLMVNCTNCHASYSKEYQECPACNIS